MYTFGNSGRKFPSDLKESAIYCNETKDLLKTAEGYVKKCLNGSPKYLLNILINTIRSQSKALCGKDSKRLQELFVSASCTNAAKFEYQKCINSSIDILLGIKPIEDKLKLPLLCCGNNKLQTCFREGSAKIDVCTEDMIEKSMRFLGSIQGNMIDVLCNKFDESSDICDRMETQYPRRPNNRKRTKSIVMPIVEVLNSFKDEQTFG